MEAMKMTMVEHTIETVLRAPNSQSSTIKETVDLKIIRGNRKSPKIPKEFLLTTLRKKTLMLSRVTYRMKSSRCHPIQKSISSRFWESKPR